MALGASIDWDRPLSSALTHIKKLDDCFGQTHGRGTLARTSYVLETPPATVVPEPATLSLFALGLLGLPMRRKLVAVSRLEQLPLLT
jgi:PEP-CTERM motif